MKTLSRTGQLVAMALFGLGKNSEVCFRSPNKMSIAIIGGLNELLDFGMIEAIPEKEIPRGAVGYKATDKIGMPIRDFSRPEPHETFNITER